MAMRGLKEGWEGECWVAIYQTADGRIKPGYRKTQLVKKKHLEE